MPIRSVELIFQNTPLRASFLKIRNVTETAVLFFLATLYFLTASLCVVAGCTEVLQIVPVEFFTTVSYLNDVVNNETRGNYVVSQAMLTQRLIPCIGVAQINPLLCFIQVLAVMYLMLVDALRIALT